MSVKTEQFADGNSAGDEDVVDTVPRVSFSDIPTLPSVAARADDDNGVNERKPCEIYIVDGDVSDKKKLCDTGLYDRALVQLNNELDAFPVNSEDRRLRQQAITDLQTNQVPAACKVSFQSWTQPVRVVQTGEQTSLTERIFNKPADQGQPRDWAYCFKPVSSLSQAQSEANGFVDNQNFVSSVTPDLSTPYTDRMTYARIAVNNLSDPDAMLRFFCARGVTETVSLPNNVFIVVKLNTANPDITASDIYFASYTGYKFQSLDNRLQRELLKKMYEVTYTPGGISVVAKTLIGTNPLLSFDVCSERDSNGREQRRLKWLTSKDEKYVTQDFAFSLLNFDVGASLSTLLNLQSLITSRNDTKLPNDYKVAGKRFTYDEYIAFYKRAADGLDKDIASLNGEVNRRNSNVAYAAGLQKDTYLIYGNNTTPQQAFNNDNSSSVKSTSYTVQQGTTKIVKRPAFSCSSCLIDSNDTCWLPPGVTNPIRPAYTDAVTSVSLNTKFAFRYNGFIRAPETGSYRFIVDTNDSADIIVNGVIVAQQTSSIQTINLEANKYYNISVRIVRSRLYYSDATKLKVMWIKPSRTCGNGSIDCYTEIPNNVYFYDNNPQERADRADFVRQKQGKDSEVSQLRDFIVSCDKKYSDYIYALARNPSNVFEQLKGRRFDIRSYSQSGNDFRSRKGYISNDNCLYFGITGLPPP